MISFKNQAYGLGRIAVLGVYMNVTPLDEDGGWRLDFAGQTLNWRRCKRICKANEIMHVQAEKDETDTGISTAIRPKTATRPNQSIWGNGGRSTIY